MSSPKKLPDARFELRTLRQLGGGDYNGYIVQLLQSATCVSIRHIKGLRSIFTLIKVCSFFCTSWRFYAAQSDSACCITGRLCVIHRHWNDSASEGIVCRIAWRIVSHYWRNGLVLPHFKFPVPISKWLAGLVYGTLVTRHPLLSCPGIVLSDLPCH